MFRADAGSPLYGDVSAVLSHQYARNTTLLSAIDTGEWTALCNTSQPGMLAPTGWPPYNTSCDAYDFALGTASLTPTKHVTPRVGEAVSGTLDHFEHLILPNIRYWKRPVPETLARLFGLLTRPLNFTHDLHPLLPTDFYTYIEGIPATRLLFPQSISFIIGSFPGLFGAMLKDA